MISNPLISEEQRSYVAGLQCLVNEVIMKRGGGAGSRLSYVMEFEVDFFNDVELALGRIYDGYLAFCGRVYKCKVQPRFITSYAPESSYVVRFSALGPVESWVDDEPAEC